MSVAFGTKGAEAFRARYPLTWNLLRAGYRNHQVIMLVREIQEKGEMTFGRIERIENLRSFIPTDVRNELLNYGRRLCDVPLIIRALTDSEDMESATQWLRENS